MSAKVQKAHSQIDGAVVSRLIVSFMNEFRDVYPREVLERFFAVGPTQSLIGHAIAEGFLAVGPGVGKDEASLTRTL